MAVPGNGPDPAALLELALTAAERAGAMLLQARAGTVEVAATKSSPTDVVTEMDRAAERMVIEILLGARPGDAVLGEEGGNLAGQATSAGADPHGVRWVVDPIDGTVNYLYDLPAWAVSVAAEIGGEVVAGVVHVPALGSSYTAVRGGGAYRNGQRLRCNADVPLAQALVATGFGYAAGRRAHQARVLVQVLPQVRDIRRYGATALDLCLLAEGKVDAYYERGPHLWDFAAGALVVREAGGLVGGLSQSRESDSFILAAGPGTFEALHALLAGLDAEQG